ncbi:MAG: ATP phosphoribosyltransferase regulatory subunit [Hyphomicrobiaceae bacterium]|nr:ATP phosphoribosyltransferase regulatory subunit [Hyphomicrobiaceae bacterium]
MPPEIAQNFEALTAQTLRLMGVFARAGYELVAPAVIQPAGPFLDVVGEELRARTYIFTDPEGEELCLRPDLTVPTCRLHLARHGEGSVPARYCYNGPAFRYQPGGGDATHPREFRQAGIECFGAGEREAADAEVAGLIAEALREAGLGRAFLRIGDLDLFATLVATLPIPDRWRRRLHRKFWRPAAFRAELARLASPELLAAHGLPADLVAAVDPTAPQAAGAVVEAHMAAAGVEIIGTRGLAEIAERIVTAAADARERPLAPETVRLIEDYAAVRAPVREATARIRALLPGAAAPALEAALCAFDRRLDLIAARGVDLDGATFSAEFGRNLAYYTGFVFELVAPELDARSAVAGGGRYDSLLADVGAPAPIPAVGACIHTERLLKALAGAPGGRP